MKLRRIAVRRMPGIDERFTVAGLGSRLSVIVGPNGSGKSTLCRAVRALLWPSTERNDSIAVEAEWTAGEDTWIARRDRTGTSWQRNGIEAPPPPLPDPGTARCFTLGFRDLLADERPADQGIAVEIRRQMSGGFDVRDLLEREFTPKTRHGQQQEARLRESQRQLERIKTGQRGLAASEDELRELERGISEAKAAAAHLELLRTAAELQSERATLHAVEQELECFPEGMARLRGGERERLDELADESSRVRKRVDSCRRELEQARAATEDARLPAGPIGDARLEGWAEKASALQQQEAELRLIERELCAARARRNEAARDLDPRSSAVDRRPALDRENMQALDGYLDRAGALRQEREILRAERAALGHGRSSMPSRVLDQGIETLRAWLAVSGTSGSVRRRRSVVAVGAALIATGPIVGLLVEPLPGWVLGVSGLSMIVAAVWTARGHGDADELRRRFDELDIVAPTEWRPGPVRERLRALSHEWSEAVVGERQDERAAALVAREEALRAREDELRDERRTLCERAGVDPDCGDLGLAQTARKLWAGQSAEADYRAARARRDEFARDRASSLSELQSVLAAHAAVIPHDGAEARPAVEELRNRNHRLRAAGDRLRRASDEIESLDESLQRIRRARDAVFAEAGLDPGDETELSARLSRRARFLELANAAERRRLRVADIRRRLDAHPELLELAVEELDRRILETQESAERYTELVERRASVRDAVKRARQGEELERALANTSRARADLEDSRQRAMFQAAGSFLLTDVGSEFDQSTRPEILARAADLFGRFTHHRYELRVDTRGEPPEFRAVETESGVGRSIAELSDATRVQLLLAVRLAFAGNVDRETGLPLFLDEILTTTDPERFHAVARSLIVLIREEDRQVIYLTANPADVNQWNRVLVRAALDSLVPIDLARLRGIAVGVHAETELEVPPLPEIPLPEGLDAERYGALVNVRRVDLRRPAAALHLFHLLRDDLGLLHALLTERIQTVGQWREFAAGGAGARLVGPERADRIVALADLAEVFFESWRIGRGRPVEADTLRDAEISETWVERLDGLVRELGGDAARLLLELERRDDHRTKGFQSRVREKLKEFLVHHGHMDEREPLGEEAIQARVRTAVAHHVDSGRLDATDVAARVHELFHQSGVYA